MSMGNLAMAIFGHQYTGSRSGTVNRTTSHPSTAPDQ